MININETINMMNINIIILTITCPFPVSKAHWRPDPLGCWIIGLGVDCLIVGLLAWAVGLFVNFFLDC